MVRNSPEGSKADEEACEAGIGEDEDQQELLARSLPSVIRGEDENERYGATPFVAAITVLASSSNLSGQKVSLAE